MFCESFRGKIKQLLRRFTAYVNEHVDTALQVTTNLKNFLSSPAASIITAIIPGDLDDKVKAALLTALGEVIPVLSIAQSCKDCPTVEETLSCFVQHLREQNPALQEAILHKLASLLAAKLDNNELPQHLYDLYTQGKYSANK